VYRGAREVLEAKRGMSAMAEGKLPIFVAAGFFVRGLVNWVAGLRAGRSGGACGAGWASRMVMFRLAYLGLAPYRERTAFLGLSEQGG